MLALLALTLCPTIVKGISAFFETAASFNREAAVIWETVDGVVSIVLIILQLLDGLSFSWA